MNLKNKIQNYYSALSHPFYSYVKILTKGYLTPHTYYNIYKYSLKSPDGNAIDIGPAQGATTIAIAKAFKKNKRDTYKVYSIEKGVASPALKSSDRHKNIEILTKNIKRCGVLNYVSIIPKYSDEAFTEKDLPKHISVLSIDADGALDRDFGIFYNNLIENAVVILDDYEDKINQSGLKSLADFKLKTQDTSSDYTKKILRDPNLLGKHLLIYRFVNYFKSEGLLVEDEIIGQNTWFGRKPINSPSFTKKHSSELAKIRDDIKKEFYSPS